MVGDGPQSLDSAHPGRPGKQTVFVANQNDDTSAISPEDMVALVESNDSLKKEFRSLNEQLAHYNKGMCTWKCSRAFPLKSPTRN